MSNVRGHSRTFTDIPLHSRVFVNSPDFSVQLACAMLRANEREARVSLKLLASVACVAVIAASGVVIWANVGGMGEARAQNVESSPEDDCRVARDFLIAHDNGIITLNDAGMLVAKTFDEDCKK